MDKNTNIEKLVSIILPTYNGSNRIGVAITSVLGQTYSNWELLVIDDGSSDSTSETVAKYVKSDSRIRYLRNEKNLGIQKTLNRGLRESQGEYIARIDDDDTWIEKNKLSLQMAYLESHSECVLVGTGAIIVNEFGNEITRYLSPETDSMVRSNMLSRNCFVHSSVLFRKDKALDIGGYSEEKETRHVEDYDLWLRLGSAGKFANVPIYGVKFLLASHNISSRNLLEQYRKNIKLVNKYKNKYPNYHRGLCVAWMRYLGAFLFGKLLSSSARGRIIGIYKKFLRK